MESKPPPPPFFIGDDPSAISMKVSEKEEFLIGLLFPDSHDHALTIANFIEDFALAIVKENEPKLRELIAKGDFAPGENADTLNADLDALVEKAYNIPAELRDFGE